MASCVVRGGVLACGYACANDQGPSRRSYGLQEIAKPFNIPEPISAGKGENSNFLLLAIPLLHFRGCSIRREMIQVNKFASPKSSCHALGQSTFSSTLCSPVSRLAPCFLAKSFHCGFWRTAMHPLLRLTRKHDASGETINTATETFSEGLSTPIARKRIPSGDTSVSGIKKQMERAEVRKQKPVTIRRLV